SDGVAVPATRYWHGAIARLQRRAEGDDAGVDQERLGKRRGHTRRDGRRQDWHSGDGPGHFTLVVYRLGGQGREQASVRDSGIGGGRRRGHAGGAADGEESAGGGIRQISEQSD